MRENQMIIEYDIDFNSLEGSDFAMMFDYNGINDWMYQQEMDDEVISEWYLDGYNISRGRIILAKTIEGIMIRESKEYKDTYRGT